MALKDWKKMRKAKTLGGQDRWESEDDQIFIGRLQDGWRVGSIYKGREEKFKTKSQALKYAKAYMRTH